MGRAWRKGGDFHRQPVAPFIFAIGDCSNLVPQLAVGLAVKDARRRAKLPFPNADRNRRIAPEVLDPGGGLARFGEQLETVAAHHEPNLDLARQARPAPDRRQIEDLLVRNILQTRPIH
jgi:hypothetical protein